MAPSPKQKDKLWSSNLVFAFIGSFLLFSAFQFLVPVLPLYLIKTFGASKETIGWGISIYILTALLIRPFAGFLVDYFARKPLLLICYAAFTVLFGGYLLAGTFALFILVRALHGFAFGLVTVSNNTIAIDLMPSSRRSEGIGVYGIASNLAMAFGPMISLYLLDKTGNFQLIFLSSLAASLAGLISVSCIRSSPRPTLIQRPLSTDRFFLVKGLPGALNTSLFSYAYGMICTYLVLYGSHELGIESGTGTYFLLMSVSLVMVRVLGTRRLNNGHIKGNISGGMMLLLVGLCFFIFIKHPISFYTSACFIGAAYGLACPAIQTMFLDLGRHDQRGTANSTYLIAWDVGAGAGILLGGQIAEYTSFSTAYLTALLLTLLALALFLQFTYRYFEKNRLRA